MSQSLDILLGRNSFLNGLMEVLKVVFCFGLALWFGVLIFGMEASWEFVFFFYFELAYLFLLTTEDNITLL